MKDVDIDGEICAVVDEVTAMMIDRKAELTFESATRALKELGEAKHAPLSDLVDVENDFELDLVWRLVLMRVLRLNTPIPYLVATPEVA